MLDLRRIVNDTDAVRAGLAKKGEVDAPIDEVIALDVRRRELIQETDSARHRRNDVSRRIGAEKRRPTDDEIQEMRSTGDRISHLETEARSVEADLRKIMLGLPNLPLDEVPEGLDESFNVMWCDGAEPAARERMGSSALGDRRSVRHHRHGERGEYFRQPFLHVARSGS